MGRNKYNYTQLEKDLNDRIIKRAESYRVFVPHCSATFGHLVVVSWKGYEDISDADLVEDIPHQKEIMKLICNLASEMKKSLTSNGTEKGKKCKKVYVVSECETDNFPFHFHLIPRFEGDSKGHEFLFEKELEEARWMLEDDTREGKLLDMYRRLGKTEGVLNHHKNLIRSNRTPKPNGDRENMISLIKETIDRIV